MCSTPWAVFQRARLSVINLDRITFDCAVTHMLPCSSLTPGIDNYTIGNEPDIVTHWGDGRVRTIVRFGVHTQTNTSVAIKISPFYNDPGLQTDYRRERDIHFYLTQTDTDEVRRNARETSDKLWTSKKNQIKTENEKIAMAVAETKRHNITPMCDFFEANIKDYDVCGVIVSKRATFTLDQYLYTLENMPLILTTIHEAIIQVSAFLHQAMVLRFTHTDLHLTNIAVFPNPRLKSLKIMTEGTFQLTGRTQYALFDFGYSGAWFFDSRDRVFDLVPQNDALKRRGIPGFKFSAFMPAVDLFRFAQSILITFAVLLARVPYRAGYDANNMKLLGTVCLAAIKVDEPIASFPDYKLLTNFCESLIKQSDQIKDRAKALASPGANNAQSTLFFEFLSVASGRKPSDMTLPYDLLEIYMKNNFAFLKNESPTSGEADDGTFYPIHGKGRIYTALSTNRTTPLVLTAQ